MCLLLQSQLAKAHAKSLVSSSKVAEKKIDTFLPLISYVKSAKFQEEKPGILTSRKFSETVGT